MLHELFGCSTNPLTQLLGNIPGPESEKSVALTGGVPSVNVVPAPVIVKTPPVAALLVLVYVYCCCADTLPTFTVPKAAGPAVRTNVADGLMPVPLKLRDAGTVPLTVSAALGVPAADGVDGAAMAQLLPVCST